MERTSMRRRFATFVVTAAGIVVFSQLLGAQQPVSKAAPLRVLVSNALREVVKEVLPEAERVTGHPWDIEYSATSVFRPRLEAGEAFDFAILTPEAVTALTKQGKIAAGESAILARVGLGLGVRAGA